MPKLSIRQAARQARVSRSTLLRAIQTGKMSAHRKEGGDGYLIEPSELFRVFEPRPPCPSDTGHPVEDHDGQGVDEPDGQGAEERADELRQERDAWRGQAEATQRQLVDLTKRPKGVTRWFRWGA